MKYNSSSLDVPSLHPILYPILSHIALGGAGPVTSGYITIVIGMRYISPYGGCYQGFTN